MRKTFTLFIALMALTISSWATQITWDQAAVQSVNVSCNGEYYYGPQSQAVNGISVTANTPNSGSNSDYSSFSYNTYSEPYFSSISVDGGGTLTFSSVGNILSIVVHTDENGYGSASGWTWSNEQHTLTWTGDAASVVLADNAYVSNITSIEFTVSVPSSLSWDQATVQSINVFCNGEYYYGPQSQAVNGISVTANTPNSGSNSDYSSFSYNTYSEPYFSSISVDGGGTLTFSSVNMTSIVIHTDENGYGSASGWTWSNEQHTLTWTGDAASVVLADNAYVSNITSIDFTFASNDPEPTPEPAVTTSTVTWDTEEVATISLECSSVNEVKPTSSIDGIIASLRRIASGGNCSFKDRDLWMNNNSGELTFTASVGNISGIVITSDHIYTEPYNLPAGWTYDSEATTLTWAGAASSQVTLSGNMDFLVSSIEFTVESAAASADPVSQGPVTWDFVNDTELASLYLRQYTHYNFHGYYQEYYDEHNNATVKDFKGIVATISAMTEGSYACFSNQNNYSIDLENGGTLTFSTELGQFQSIVINTTSYGSSSGEWAWDPTKHTLTWAGTPANSVVLDDIDISDITSIVFTFVSAAPAFTADITWDATEVATISLYGSSFNTVVSGSEIDGITPSIMKTNDGYCYFDNSKIKMQNNGELIFTSSVGDIQGIVLTFDNTESYTISDFPVGWTLNDVAGTLTWEGTAADEVSLSGNISCTVTSIEFDVDPSTAPLTPSGSNFLWQSRQLNLVELYCTGLNEVQKTNVIKNVITSLERTVVNSDYCYFQNGSIKLVDNGELTFQSIVGDFTGIVITGSAYTTPTNLPANWAYNSTAGTLTWMGTPAEQVTLSGDIDINISSIEFFYDPEDAPYVGTKFFGVRDQWYEITGAHTAKMPVQTINHTLDVPASVEYLGETYYVTEIVDNAFKNNVDLPNAYIGANVARIGAHAFEGCFRMDEVTVNSTVLESIGDEAFKNCQLMHIFECSTNLPPELGSNVFEGDTRVNHYNVLNEYVANRYKAADGWSALADKIYLIFGEPDLGEVFFWNNQMTTNLYAVAAVSPAHEAKIIPYTVNDLYPRTLEGRLTIPEEVRYMNKDYDVAVIGADAYKDATLIDFVLIPQAVKTIEAGAFSGCTGVTNVQFLWDDLTGITWADGNVGAEFATAASGNTKICVPMGKLAAYQAWAPAWASRMVEGELLDIDVTASQDPDHVGRYYRTFYDSKTDYLMPPSVWAHAGYIDGKDFILRPVAFDGQILPRNTAVVLESETPTYRLIPMGNTAPLYTGPNDLIGTDVNILRTSVGNNGENVYVLGKQATIGGDLRVGMGMYRYTGTTLGAHKAYMILNTSNPSSAPVRFLFKHEEATEGVENVQSDNIPCTKILRNGQLLIIKNGKVYNAQGQIIK